MQPKISFLIRVGDGQEFAFQEVSGLKSSAAGYREKIHGLRKPREVTLKRGVIASSMTFWNWLRHSKTPVVIKFVDEFGRVDAAWKLVNAWPTKMTTPSLNAQGDDVVIEEIVVAYERLEIEPSNADHCVSD
jgi:phage tail-like protein